MFARAPGPAIRLLMWSALCVMLIVLDARFNALGWLRAGVVAVFYPVQLAVRAPFDLASEVSGFLTRHRALQNENAALRENSLRASAGLARLDSLQAENEELRGLLALRQNMEFGAVTAEILSTPRDPFSQRIMLDKGENFGIAAGQPVVDGTGLVGQVTRAYPFSAEVTLVTDRGHAVPVQIQRTGQRVLVFGAGSAMEVRYLPTHTDIQPGDVLVTSGIDRVYPAGLAVAKVTRVQRPTDSPYARVSCLPTAGVDKSRMLMVLKTPGGVRP
ncbi:MAG: rod shape-determining protein MreC [Pseudomonadota bacterium]